MDWNIKMRTTGKSEGVVTTDWEGFTEAISES